MARHRRLAQAAAAGNLDQIRILAQGSNELQQNNQQFAAPPLSIANMHGKLQAGLPMKVTHCQLIRP